MTSAAAVFLAALGAAVVEALETAVILLAIKHTRGLKPMLLGMGAGLAVLATLIVLLLPLVQSIPRNSLYLVLGLLLLLFGAGWLRKAVLRSAGRARRHDFDAEYSTARRDFAAPKPEGRAGGDTKPADRVVDSIAAMAAFKAVLLEGLEVAFVVLALGGAERIGEAAAGALAGCVLVAAGAYALRRPVSRIPDNALKFWTSVMLMAFGTYWIANGLNAAWPGGEFALLVLVAFYAVLGGGLIRRLRGSKTDATSDLVNSAPQTGEPNTPRGPDA